MEINTLRIAVTLVTLVAFLWIVCWAYRPSRRQSLEQQARSILEDAEEESGS